MLKIEIAPTDQENISKASIQIEGNIPTILKETCNAINGIYTSLINSNPRGAERFKSALTLALLLPDSPIWDPKMGNKKGVQVAMKTLRQEDLSHD